MKNLELIKDFFGKRTVCPICGSTLLRKIKAYWQNRTKKLEFISDPIKADDYKNMIFVKYAESAIQLLNQDVEDMASPSIINLKEKSPPSLTFLNIVEAVSLCPRSVVEYHLWAKGPDFIPVSERFWLSDYDIFITQKNINETVNGLVIQTDESHILRYSAEEIKLKVDKLVLLQ